MSAFDKIIDDLKKLKAESTDKAMKKSIQAKIDALTDDKIVLK